MGGSVPGGGVTMSDLARDVDTPNTSPSVAGALVEGATIPVLRAIWTNGVGHLCR